jgi:hypothetical protein
MDENVESAPDGALNAGPRPDAMLGNGCTICYMVVSRMRTGKPPLCESLATVLKAGKNRELEDD